MLIQHYFSSQPSLPHFHSLLYILSIVSCIFSLWKPLKQSQSANVEDSLTNLLDFPFINEHVKLRQLRRRGMHNTDESWLKGSRRNMVHALTFLSWSYFMAVPDAAVAARMQPRWVRAWEDPKLRGKPPAKPLVAKPGEPWIIYKEI